jgi:NTE family protein
MKGKKVGLILSGGGARGFAHIGVLKVLEENKIKISCIAGSSMGIIIGSLYAAGLSAKKIEQIALSINQSGFLKILDITFSTEGLIKGDKIIEFVKNYLPVDRFEKLKIPLVINATDLVKKKEVVFKKGDLLSAIRAGISVPGLIVPERRNNQILMDGGLVNPLGLGLFKDIEHDFLIIVNVSTGFGGRVNLSRPSVIDLLKRSVNIMEEHLIELKLKTINEKYFLIQPEVEQFELFDMKQVKELISLGEIGAYKKIEKIKESYYS